jgi:hypothetical protein
VDVPKQEVKWLAPTGRIGENQSRKEECINVFAETGSSEIEGADNEIWNRFVCRPPDNIGAD